MPPPLPKPTGHQERLAMAEFHGKFLADNVAKGV